MIRAILDLLRALVAPVVGWLAWRKGKADARAETALEAAERYAKTRKAMDDADAIVGDDPAAARRWLSERDPAKR